MQIQMQVVFTTEAFLEEATGGSPKRDVNQRPLSFVPSDRECDVHSLPFFTATQISPSVQFSDLISANVFDICHIYDNNSMGQVIT